eukprot:TRINITY_DN23728_c0_g1_i1.p1 TRINITY_DN23728_c0_g1~~TRINITY_DN23728_c0_g1_i1.p1  ORF type:complete len:352 (+),score=44.20 TRINITY_DN23728_c0_g1_i1:75-1130(+)
MESLARGSAPSAVRHPRGVRAPSRLHPDAEGAVSCPGCFRTINAQSEHAAGQKPKGNLHMFDISKIDEARHALSRIHSFQSSCGHGPRSISPSPEASVSDASVGTLMSASTIAPVATSEVITLLRGELAKVVEEVRIVVQASLDEARAANVRMAKQLFVSSEGSSDLPANLRAGIASVKRNIVGTEVPLHGSDDGLPADMKSLMKTELKHLRRSVIDAVGSNLKLSLHELRSVLHSTNRPLDIVGCIQAKVDALSSDMRQLHVDMSSSFGGLECRILDVLATRSDELANISPTSTFITDLSQSIWKQICTSTRGESRLDKALASLDGFTRDVPEEPLSAAEKATAEDRSLH